MPNRKDSIVRPANERELIVSKARTEDAAVVAAILTSAAKWLEDTGRWNDWPIPYPVSILLHPISSGNVYLACNALDHEALATVTLQCTDERYWGSRPPDAVYLHRLAHLPHAKGGGIGAALIDWAADWAHLCGRSYLRLDCPAPNQDLREYYEALGFTCVGLYNGDSDYRAILLERRLV